MPSNPSSDAASQTRLIRNRRGLYKVSGAYGGRYEFFKDKPFRVVIAPQEVRVLSEHAGELKDAGVIVRNVSPGYSRAAQGHLTLEVEADGRRILVQGSSGAGVRTRPSFKRIAGTDRLDPGSVKQFLFDPSW